MEENSREGLNGTHFSPARQFGRVKVAAELCREDILAIGTAVLHGINEQSQSLKNRFNQFELVHLSLSDNLTNTSISNR